MNLLIDDRISGTRDFANQFVLFPTRCGRENRGEEPVSRLSRDQLEPFYENVRGMNRVAFKAFDIYRCELAKSKSIGAQRTAKQN